MNIQIFFFLNLTGNPAIDANVFVYCKTHIFRMHQIF